MLTLSTTPASPWLFFKVWIADNIEKFSSFFNFRLTVFTDNIIEKNDFIIESINKKREEANNISPALAMNKLNKFQRTREAFERIETYISNSSNAPLKSSFRLLVKASNKYEARLHKIAYSDKPVIKTPEHIKEGFSEMGKESVKSYLKSHNAF